MPVAAEPSSSSSTTIGEHIRYGRSRNQPTRNLRPLAVADDPPLTTVIPPTAQPTRLCKSALSSFFLLPNSSSSNETAKKKPNGFPQATSFRGLGCTAAASQEVSVPAVIRSSAEWETRKVKDKKKKKCKKKKGGFNGGSIKIVSESRGFDGGGCVAIPDVWCGPGIGFSTDAVVGGSSVDSVVSGPPKRSVPTRRKIDGDKHILVNHSNNQRESSSVLPRRSLNQESLAFLDSNSPPIISLPEPATLSNRYRRHLRHSSPDDLAEIMMLQNGFVMGGMLDLRDHFRDWRLDVDNMSYEQLLELGDRIGYVSTGLKEEEINRCLRRIKPSSSNFAMSNSIITADKKCSICQEEYEMEEEEEEMGKLECGHSFHIDCVKQWLSRKNACPVCKTAAYVRPLKG